MDLSKTETKLQKEVGAIVNANKKKAEDERLAALEREEALKSSQSKMEEEEASEKSDDEKPKGIVQPKFKVVHSYPVDIGDSW